MADSLSAETDGGRLRVLKEKVEAFNTKYKQVAQGSNSSTPGSAAAGAGTGQALRSNRAPCRSHSSQRETAQLTWGRPSSRQLPLICLNLKQPRSFLDQLVSRSVSYPTKSFNTTLHPQKLSTDFCRFEFDRAIKFQCEAFGEVSGNQQQQDPRRHFHR